MINFVGSERFWTDARGNVGMLFAISVVPLVFGVGAAVDYAHATALKGQLQGMVDAVALSTVVLPAAQRDAAADTALTARVNASELDVVAKSWASAPDGTFTATVAASTPTAFMKLIGVATLTLNARAVAKPPPPAPLTATFTTTGAQGWYWKSVTVWTHAPGAASDRLIASYTFQPTYFDQPSPRGTGNVGTITSNPSASVTFQAYDRLYLRMSVRGNGCPPNEAPAPNTGRNGVILQCLPSPGATDPADLELRTDDPNTAHHLFVAGQQLPRGVVVPLTDILKCGQTVSHAWEDGGNFSEQDFFFDVSTTCGAANWLPARLVN
ncbi:MAG: hypothetical protein IPL88_06080 [Rhizobiales bacterium]|nr:hypothetical protein [Hyphomicrobiales bacterium]